MVHFLYSCLLRMLLPCVLIKFVYVALKRNNHHTSWREYLGFIKPSGARVIWVHAVSVGETIAAAPLVRALMKQYPNIPVLMTATTNTGAERAKALFGDQVHYAQFPCDTPGSVRRFLRRARPYALVIMETELWPNVIRETHKISVPIYLINARLSERSAKGYRRIGLLSRPMLKRIDWIAAQALDDAHRFESIGASAGSITVTGNIKFDVTIDDSLRASVEQLRNFLGNDRPIWLAASTHEGEDELILGAHQQILTRLPHCLLIIVPRHPERFDSVYDLIGSMSLRCVRRSLREPANDAQVYLGDTMGELLLLYGASDAAFVGGSLVPRGGHNPLEPAAWGIPILAGPSVFNFATIYSYLDAGGGLLRVGDSAEIAERIVPLLNDPSAAARMGQKSYEVLRNHRGALQHVVDGIVQRSKFDCVGEKISEAL